MSENIICNKDDFGKVMEQRKKDGKNHVMSGNVKADKEITVGHAESGNLLIKLINTIHMDPVIKKVLTMRIVGPMTTGVERSHMSIAIELGINCDEIHEIEAAGMEIVDSYLQRICAEDYVGKFNADRRLEEEVRKIQQESGKSVNTEVQKET